MSDATADATTSSPDERPPRPWTLNPPVNPFTRWTEIADGSGGAAAYQHRFDELEARGFDVHAEAKLVASLVAPPARVLDAGCGTGRVATTLTELGYRCTGVDADLEMILYARQRDPATRYIHADLAELYLRSQAFEAVILAGNVVPLLAEGALGRSVRRIAAHSTPDGVLVAGFGLDPAHLPPGCPVTPLADYDAACASSGLVLVDRWSTWDQAPWSPDAGYAVSVHRRH